MCRRTRNSSLPALSWESATETIYDVMGKLSMESHTAPHINHNRGSIFADDNLPKSPSTDGLLLAKFTEEEGHQIQMFNRCMFNCVDGRRKMSPQSSSSIVVYRAYLSSSRMLLSGAAGCDPSS